ncbi:MATE family efflux transporter [uncultured Methylophaga sp.]|uniref:MATE family efflux transporter n=1 Tax=uncultured Methylophaga sp. TaxID=285271 RepID=UPI00262468F0|nr:MATE family efflux transporter [uncultured Methylophaga sp.]
MTEHIVTHRQVWRIAGPMIIANISTPLLGMVDTAMVGHLSAAHYLGAVAIGSMIFTFVFWGFGFLRMATTGLTSQAYGENSTAKMQAVLMQSIWLALIIALLLLLLQIPIRDMALHLVDSSGDVEHFAAIYFDIRIFSAPATLINYAILGWLIGREASKAALLMVLVINITNILLDGLFVMGLGMDVDGVALASVIAEYTGLIMGLILLNHYGLSKSGIRLSLSKKVLQQSRHGLTVHGNVMIRTFLLISCFALFTTQGARQGDTVLAANSVLLNFITLMAFVLDGFANATEALTGKAIGRKSPPMLRKALSLTAFWSVLMAALFSLTYLLFGEWIIRLLTGIDEVIEYAGIHLVWVIIAPLIAVWSYLLDGLFVGATRSREMRNTMLFSALCCYLPAFYLLQPFGNHGLWAALLIFLAARGLSQSLYISGIMRLADPN